MEEYMLTLGAVILTIIAIAFLATIVGLIIWFVQELRK